MMESTAFERLKKAIDGGLAYKMELPTFDTNAVCNGSKSFSLEAEWIPVSNESVEWNPDDENAGMKVQYHLRYAGMKESVYSRLEDAMSEMLTHAGMLYEHSSV